MIKNILRKSMKPALMVTVAVILVLVLQIALPVLQNPINKFLGDLGIKSTFTVAFYNSVEAATADYTVDGTADDVQVQQAVDALPSTGGKVILYGGNYNFTATISRAIDNVVIAGSGKATYLAYNASTALISAGAQSAWIFEDFRTDAGFVTVSSAGDTRINRVWKDSCLIDAVVPSGTTLPTTPVKGQLFLHAPTGRTILYQYNGSSWSAIQSYGTMTMYVDKTDGTDDTSHGTAVDGSAFATVQYAIDTIPPNYGGNVTIYINAESYAETVTIRGKSPTGNYTIILQGTLTSIASGTQSTNGTQGTGATQGAFTDTGNLDGTSNKLAYLDSDGDYRIVDSEDDNTATIVGTFTSQPLQNENYVVYDWGTTITRINVYCMNVNLYNLKLSNAGTTCLLVSASQNFTAYYCSLLGFVSNTINSGAAYYYCYIYDTGSQTFDASNYTSVNIYGCKICNYNNSGAVTRSLSGGYLGIRSGTVIDGDAGSGNKATYGERVFFNAVVTHSSDTASGYPRVRNSDTGIAAYQSAIVINTTNIQYTNNGTDEDATAGTFGYID